MSLFQQVILLASIIKDSFFTQERDEHFLGWQDEATFERRNCDQTSSHTKYHKVVSNWAEPDLSSSAELWAELWAQAQLSFMLEPLSRTFH